MSAISHTVHSHRTAYSRKEQVATCMVSVRAAEYCPENRKPVDIVLVIDKSGSMGCNGKMDLTIETAELVAKELGPTDRLCIITYDSDVYCPMPLTRMDKSGKETAAAAIQTIKPGSTTNLSGGLLRGIEELAGCPDLSDSCSILLMTDGLANNGIQDSAELVKCLEGTLGTMPKPPSVFSFGYGADHDEDMLRAIADCGSGVYYFMQSGDMVASSFADCLGGLLSVVAQNVRVTVTATNGVPLKLLGDGYKTAPAAGGGIEITLGDMYSEEEKDLLFELPLSAEAGSAEALKTEMVASLSCFDVVNTKPVAKLVASCSIARADAEGAVNIQVDTQRNRVMAAEAIKQANALARNSTDLSEGRQRLAEMKLQLWDSPASKTPLCQQLMTELTACEDGLRDRQTYEGRGRFAMAQASQMHSVQRCNTSSVSVYKTSGKARMQTKWAAERLTASETAAAGRKQNRGAQFQARTQTLKSRQDVPSSGDVGSGMLGSMASFFGCSTSAPPKVPKDKSDQ